MARSAYPEYGSQGLASPWMAADASGAPRTRTSSWGTYGHDTTPITPVYPSYTHHPTNAPQATAAGAAGHWAESNAAAVSAATAWSAYPPPSQSFSPMSQMASTPTGAYDSRKTPGSAPAMQPAADMYPPLPNMGVEGQSQHQHPHASSSSPSAAHQHHHQHQQQQQASNYGSWGHPQAYPPINSKEGGYSGGAGWYSQQGAAGHHAGPTQPSMTHGMSVTDGYYTQR